VSHYSLPDIESTPNVIPSDPEITLDILALLNACKRPFGKTVIEPCGARIGVIQAGDVDAAEPGSNGPDRQEDEALPVGSDG